MTQVREIATECMHISKGFGISTFLIGHVTKSGEIAGPRVLEHIVDTVLDFEGDRQHGYRIMRAVKNRFGPTDDVALFQMGAEGLTEVTNPSEIFLEERVKEVSGSVVIPTIEGTPRDFDRSAGARRRFGLSHLIAKIYRPRSKPACAAPRCLRKADGLSAAPLRCVRFCCWRHEDRRAGDRPRDPDGDRLFILQ